MKRYQYLDFIIYLNITMMAVVNVISGKIVQVGFLTLSAASLCIPVTYIIGDTLTEVYGYKQARRATWILIASSVITALFFQLAVWVPPAPGFMNNQAYKVVLGQVPRVVVGAFVALFAGQFINDYVMAKLKLLTRGRYLWTRTIGSTVAGQAADSICFYTIALYNVVPSGMLLKSIFSAWFLKVLIETVMTSVTYRVIRKLKQTEGIDTFDTHTNFNPFIFRIEKADSQQSAS